MADDRWKATADGRPATVLGMGLAAAQGWCDRHWPPPLAVDLELKNTTWLRRGHRWISGEAPDLDEQIEAALGWQQR